MEEKQVYTLPEIAEWGSHKDFLPQVQRGFVWKPYQIENLWDSLLRGYPVGAFVLSPKINKESFEMLDGQQRATAICLGFGKETFRDSQDNVKVFIALKKPTGDSRKYLFRVITKSHPWGYQKNDNTKTLTSDKIREAMLAYGIEDHLDENIKLDHFYPYDASLPIPFHFFIEAAMNIENDNLVVKLLEERIRDWQFEKKGYSNKKENEVNSESDELYKITEIFSAVKKMLGKQKIPALYLNLEQFDKEEGDTLPHESDIVNEHNENIDQLEDNDKTDDPIENLFIRLNSGGTPLRGEELNYSILKAKIDTDLQTSIETACKGFLKPARFITIAYRLYQHEKKEESSDALIMRIKPKQFQKTIARKESYNDIEKFLKGLLTYKKYSGKTLLEYARYILEYNEKANAYGIPYLTMIKIAEGAPEVMFLLLYRLMKNKDVFEFGTDLHRKMIGIITLFVWLGKGKNRDHSKLLSSVWIAAKNSNQKIFWSSSSVQRAMLVDGFIPIPKYNDLHQIREITLKLIKTSNIWTRYQEKGLRDISIKMLFNRDLIEYAQRDFLSKIFTNQQYHLDDTNTPFDWDHIAAYSYIKNKKGLPDIIRQLYNSNGNFRAWPYSLNRIDQDGAPAKKLDPDTIKYSQVWIKFYNTHSNLFEKTIIKQESIIQDELKKQLLKWSFCDKEWATMEINNMKDDWRDVTKLIISRNLTICKEWYDNLKINDLIPIRITKKSISDNFQSKLDGRKWHSRKKSKNKEIENIYQMEEVNYWVYYYESVTFFILHPSDHKEIVNENGITFGILRTFINTINTPDAYRIQNYMQDNENNLIEGNFTLISHDQDSYKILFDEFDNWLQKSPDKEIKSLLKPFRNSLRI